MTIPFNKPYISGKEQQYINEVLERGHLSGNGEYTKKCHRFFEQIGPFNKCLLTTSCTDALEMAAVLSGVQAGDEVIMPSYTFVSTANPYALKGAKIIFADSCETHPNIDVLKIEELITEKTKVILAVHYSGVACDMDIINGLAKKYNLFVIEDAAQAIDNYYKGHTLGSIGHLGAYSFHETKNIISGEGGALLINDKSFIERAEIIWEKGTNRAAFFRGETDKYNWVDVGSSYLPSEIIAAFLFAQLEQINKIQEKRKSIWAQYYSGLTDMAGKEYFKLPYIPDYSSNNAHSFYLICNHGDERTELINYLKKNGIHAVFHYLSLHKSPFYNSKHDGRTLIHADRFTDTLVRLPMYYELEEKHIEYIINTIFKFYKSYSPAGS